jgi:hypothetical protein
VEKYREETATYRQFLGLLDAYILVNERIADFEPVPAVASDDALAALKKISC